MEDGTLAGSTLTMNQAVALMVRQVGLPLEEALAMASFVPAKRLSLSDQKGSLAPGKDADLVVLDDHFQVQLTAVRGNIIFQR
jgi:N-acetylglucosamine-6-phosphate deacetylase